MTEPTESQDATDEKPAPLGGLPKAGWYADPADESRQRWWDGQQWGTQLSTDDAYSSTRRVARSTTGLRRAGDWLREAIAQSLGRFGHFLPLILLLVLPTALLSSVAAWWVFREAIFIVDVDSGVVESTGLPSSPAPWVAFVALQIVALFGSYWLFGSATHQSEAALDDEPVSWSESARAGLRMLPRVALAFLSRLLVLALACVLVGLLTFALSLIVPALAVGFVALALPAVLIGLWLRLSLVGTIVARSANSSVAATMDEAGVVVESGTPARGQRTNPLAASWRMTSGFSLDLFVRFLLILFVYVGIWIVASTLSSLFGVSTEAGTPPYVPGEPLEFKVSDVLPANIALQAIGALFGGLGSGARQIVLAVASLGLHRDISDVRLRDHR